jgi:hypothetical protein
MNFVVFESIFGYNGAMSKTMNLKTAVGNLPI